MVHFKHLIWQSENHEKYVMKTKHTKIFSCENVWILFDAVFNTFTLWIFLSRKQTKTWYSLCASFVPTYKQADEKTSLCYIIKKTDSIVSIKKVVKETWFFG